VDIGILHEGLHRIRRVPIPNAVPGDRFGETIAIRGDLVAVGAPRSDVDGFLDRGRVVTARLTGRGLEPLGEPVPERSRTGLRFGGSILIEKDLIIGAPGAEARGHPPRLEIDRAGIVVRCALSTPHHRIESIQRSDADRLDRFGSWLAGVEDLLLVGSPRAALNGVRSGVISMVSPGPEIEIGAADHPESGLGGPLVCNGRCFAAGMPARLTPDLRRLSGVRLGLVRPGVLVTRLDLVFNDRERTATSLALSASGGILVVGAADPSIDDGPETPGRVHLVHLDPVLRRAHGPLP
jgi:hypothetical protein